MINYKIFICGVKLIVLINLFIKILNYHIWHIKFLKLNRLIINLFIIKKKKKKRDKNEQIYWKTKEMESLTICGL